MACAPEVVSATTNGKSRAPMRTLLYRERTNGPPLSGPLIVAVGLTTGIATRFHVAPLSELITQIARKFGLVPFRFAVVWMRIETASPSSRAAADMIGAFDPSCGKTTRASSAPCESYKTTCPVGKPKFGGTGEPNGGTELDADACSIRTKWRLSRL